ncbi:rCG41799 [Rattus norvegicus]|uniref:RCG41799 n=1 Tax=Rattus norvegicus TaxID=10116 RepID=A6KT49_RAT|nr:rCG41799 [Rattus norvegicus]
MGGSSIHCLQHSHDCCPGCPWSCDHHRSCGGCCEEEEEKHRWKRRGLCSSSKQQQCPQLGLLSGDLKSPPSWSSRHDGKSTSCQFHAALSCSLSLPHQT